MRLLRTLTLGLVVVLLAACADDVTGVSSGDDPVLPDDGATAPPDGDPTFVGTLTSVTAFEPVTEDCVDPSNLDPGGSVSSDDPPFCTDPANTNQGTVLLESDPGVQEGDKASLTVDGDTVLLRRTSDGFEPVTFDDLAGGDTAEAWVFGPIAESYPVQARADALVIG